MWIKICGLNDRATAREVAALRPDAIGLNFYERSVRYVPAEAARGIRDLFPAEVAVIGVFVEPSVEFLRRTVAELRLDGIQLHTGHLEDAFGELIGQGAGTSAATDAGSEPAATVRRIRAFQIGSQGLGPLDEYFESRRQQRIAIDACLVDGCVEGKYGGTGEKAPWDLLRDGYRRDAWPALVLSGGLRVENVAEAIATVRPWGVDVASGVESAPGIKDVRLVARFIDEARSAFEAN